jgi:ABC-type nitrate/sulfonate/bicarbonate transport system substrate-binding protein
MYVVILVPVLWLSQRETEVQGMQRTNKLRVIVFPGGFNWPIWVAQEQCWFEREGVAVEVTRTPGSVYQMTRLIAGEFDVAHTAFDNVVAYAGNGGGARSGVGTDLAAFMGGDDGLLRLISAPGVNSYADLKGEKVSVDAPNTGYALVLREMLAANGIAEKDYELVTVGGVLQRWEALLKGRQAATLLVTPFETIAEEKGFNLLGSASDIVGPYQGLAGVASRSWAAIHADELVAYVRAYLAGLSWLYDPANREAATEILVREAALPKAVADRAYGILLDPVRGISPTARLDPEGVANVLALRSKYAPIATPLDDPSGYLDLTYYLLATETTGAS